MSVLTKTNMGARRVVAVETIADVKFESCGMPLELRLTLLTDISDFLTDQECNAFCVAAYNQDNATMDRIAVRVVEYVFNAAVRRGKGERAA
jgi:hypothetical protein